MRKGWEKFKELMMIIVACLFFAMLYPATRTIIMQQYLRPLSEFSVAFVSSFVSSFKQAPRQ
jgi:hypothetical protein